MLPSPPFAHSCTLWIHDNSTFPSKAVVFNTGLLPEGSTRIGRVLKVIPAANSTDPLTRDATGISVSDVRDYAPGHTHDSNQAQNASVVGTEPQPFVFVIVDDVDADERAKYRNLQISVSKDVAAAHGFYSRMPVLVTDGDTDEHAASHVELSFSDPLNRADLWKTTISELSRRKCIYQGQALLFLGSIRIVVKKLFVDGRRAPSGLFTKDSKPIFRSTSARFILGLQVSREMLEFDDELSTGILWTKAADFVSTLLDRWKAKGMRHMLSIVLFTRLNDTREEDNGDAEPVDMYRVVASDLPDFNNVRIMRILTQSFRSFTHEMRVQRFGNSKQEDLVSKTVATARRGNLLEAINVAISSCWLDEQDLDFERTGTSIVMVSPGTGSFHVDENLLKVTSERLSGRSIGVELVCLSALPLHIVPLFILPNKSGKELPLVSEHNSRQRPPTGRHRLAEQHSQSLSRHVAHASAHNVFVMPTWIETSFYKFSGFGYDLANFDSAAEAHRLADRQTSKRSKLPRVTRTQQNASAPLFPRWDGLQNGTSSKELVEKMERHDARLFSIPKQSDDDSEGSGQSSLGMQSRYAQHPSDESPASSIRPSKPERRISSRSGSSTTVDLTRSQDAISKGRLSSLLGRSALGKAGPTTGSSIEQASSIQRPKSSQQPKAHPRTVSGQLQLSLARTTSSSLVHSSTSSLLSLDQLFEETSDRQSLNSVKAIDGQPDILNSNSSALPRQKEGSLRSHKRNSMSASSAVAIRNALPWLVIKNPCRTEMEALDAFGEWNHAFTSERKAHAVKWKALCAPASLPLTTEHFPSQSELEAAFTVNPYRISLHATSTGDQAIAQRRGHLAREMVLYRISEGFQIAVGPVADRVIGPQATSAADFWADDFMYADGAAVMMLKGDDVHVLCATGDEVAVTRYHRRADPATAVHSQPLIRTYMDDAYHQRPLTFSVRPTRNWSKIDNDTAETEADSHERAKAMPITSSNMRQARFVLIPVDPPNIAKQNNPTGEENDEELRLDGIRKLTTLWQNNRYVPPEDEKYLARWIGPKDELNPLAIEYQTMDPSAIVAAGFESRILTEGEGTTAITHLFDEDEQYSTSHVDLQKLAAELQGDRGVNVRSRSWHIKRYEYCFVGHDLIGFLMLRFQDIPKREEAVEFGNVLMRKGLFNHVNNKHQFRDGNYFFSICKEYRAPKEEPKSTWFNVRKALTSVPATPMSDAPREPVDLFAVHANSGLPRRPKVILSGTIQYEVDPKHISTRPEIITIHYDRLHNPDNAFHFMLEWTNATAKLVEDALSSWGGTVSRYGLKLVRVPIAEVVRTPQVNPLRTPYTVEMARKAAPAPSINVTDGPALRPMKTSSAKHFQKALLKKFDFVLDFEASSSFPLDVDVTYSYGQDDFEYDQYVHRSGLLLAQIVDDWKFIILANRLCSSRMGTHRVIRTAASHIFERTKGSSMPRPSSVAALSTMTEGTSSPVTSPRSARASQPHSERHSQSTSNTGRRISTRPFGNPGEQLLIDFEAFCSDVDALRTFYEEVSKLPPEKPTPALSAISAAQTPSLRASIPNLDLPEAFDRGSTAI